MEYGAAYLRPRQSVNDDEESILAEHRVSQYQPYNPIHRRQSSDALPDDRLSWNVSPVALQQSLPPLQPSFESPSEVRPSVFGSRAHLDEPYQEPAAWEHSNYSRPPRTENPKPEVPRTNIVQVPESKPAKESRRYFRHPRHIPEPWRSGFWLRFPWLGCGALLGVVILTGVAAGILLASNNTSPKDWRVGKDNAQPQVYISICEWIMNFLILFALVEGVVIKFWRQLLHGTTLSALHDVYESSTPWSAMRRVFRFQFNAVAIACLIAVVSTIRGPLFQRALTIEGGFHTSTQGTVNLKMAPFPMVEYLQSSDSDPRKGGGITQEFATILRDLNAGSALPFSQPADCGESCTGTVKGFTFKPSCTTSTQTFDLSNLPNKCKSCTSRACRDECSSLLNNDYNPAFFSIDYRTNAASATDAKDQEMVLTSVFKNESSCAGELQVHTCSLKQITTDYSIMITNGTIDRIGAGGDDATEDDSMELSKSLMEKFWPFAFESLFPPVSVNVTPTENYSRLQYRTCVKSQDNQPEFDGNQPLSVCSNGTTLQGSLSANDASLIYATPMQESDEDPLCGLTWRDPMQDMLDKMQSLAFRITVDMANSNGSVFSPSFTGEKVEELREPWAQEVSVSGYEFTSVYKSDVAFVIVGVMLSIMGVAAIIPLYMGFWELGRKVSLNPLEIARAFGAPLLEGLDGNVTGDMVTLERGGMSVRYGALERYGEEKKLRVEETARATVRVPWQNEVFG